VCFSPDGSLLASDSWDGKLRLWDFHSGKEIINIPADSESVSFAPDGRRIAVGGYSQSALQLFEIALNDITSDAPAFASGPQANNYDTLVFGGRDRWLATCANQAVTLWRSSDMKPLACVSNFSASCAEWLPARRSIFTFNTNGLYYIPVRQTNDTWSAGPPEPFQPVIPEALQAQCPSNFFLSFTDDLHPERSSASSNGQAAAITYQDRAYIFDTEHGTLQAVTGEQTWMKFIGLSPDGERVATGGWNNPNVKIWSATTGALERELTTGYSPNVAFSPDGRWLVTSTSVDFSFWRTSDWRLDHKIERPPWGLPGPLCFSADSKVLALAYTRGVVRLIEPDSGQTIAQLEPTPDNEVIGLALNADLSELAMTRFGEPPQIWRLSRIRHELTAMGLDWTTQ
jgi:WD40 repeat protein